MVVTTAEMVAVTAVTVVDGGDTGDGGGGPEGGNPPLPETFTTGPAVIAPVEIPITETEPTTLNPTTPVDIIVNFPE